MGIIKVVQVGFYKQKMAGKVQASGKEKAAGASKSAQAAKQRGAKTKAKKWGKVKVADKANNEVYLEQKKYDKILTEVPKILCVTRAVLIEKFKVNGSIARSLIQELASRGDIKRVGDAHHSFDLFTGTKAKSAAEKEKEELAAREAKEKKGKKE